MTGTFQFFGLEVRNAEVVALKDPETVQGK
jgi:hypothetical protein